MIIKIDRGTILAGQPITPKWYKGYVKKVGPHEVKGERIDAIIQVGFNSQHHPELAADERSIDHTFYNAAGKGVGFLVSFMAAIKNEPAKSIADKMERGETVDFDIDKTVDSPIMFKVINEPYQGRLLNKIEAWLPFDAEVPLEVTK